MDASPNQKTESAEMNDRKTSTPDAADTLGALPNLVIVGAMKCGTTSLHEYLSIHPSIQMSSPKEVDYFAGRNATRSLDWYKGLFDPSYSVRGEASQNYAKCHLPFYANAVPEMAKVIPEAKLIYMVRDPIDRLRSHRYYNYFNGSWEELKSISADAYIDTGKYAMQLDNILRYYDISQILVLDLSDLRKDRTATMNRIFRFLGVPEMHDDSLFDFVSNTKEDLRVPIRLRSRIAVRAACKLLPGPMSRLLNARRTQEFFRAQASQQARLGEQELSEVRAAYATDVARLRSLTGQDFSGWSF